MTTTITHGGGVITPTALDGYEAEREVRNRVHDVINRTNPDITFRVAGTRTGKLKCVFDDIAAVIAAYTAICTPQVLTLANDDIPGLGMSFVLGPDGQTASIVADDSRAIWTITIPFVEVIP